MTRRTITDEELAKMSAHRRGQIIRARRARDKKLAEQAAAQNARPEPPKQTRSASVIALRDVVVPFEKTFSGIATHPNMPALPPGGDGQPVTAWELEARALIVYDSVRESLIKARIWNEVAHSGLARTYAKTTAIIECTPVELMPGLPAHIASAQRAAAASLGLTKLEADTQQRKADRFGGQW